MKGLQEREIKLFKSHLGALIGSTLIIVWLTTLLFAFQLEWSFFSIWPYLLVLVQTHLYTGLFITAHDAMHGIVSPNKKLNHFIGWIAAGLFAFNYYPSLYKNHHKHHNHVATEEDPDYHHGGFLSWYAVFLKHYLTIWQILLMAATFNVLILFFPEPNVLMFWVIPSLLSTLQLFYFGTYQPHKQETDPGNEHHSTTLANNHWWAFLSCYFFGYHYEHHEYPWVPWWLLFRVKDRISSKHGT